MFIDQGYPVRKVLSYSNVASSTWYKRQRSSVDKSFVTSKGRPRQECKTKAGVSICDQEIKNNLKVLRNKKFHSHMGYRKLMHFLRRDFDLIINHKKVYRLYSEAGLTLPVKKKSKRRGKKICENRTVTGPNQLWQFDIKYGYIDGEN